MRIPPLHRRKGYQRFFAGIILGFIIGWFFFLLSYGSLQDFYMTEILRRDEQIGELKKNLHHYMSEYEEKNKEIEKNLRVQEIEVTILNREKAKLTGLTFHELEKSVKFELHDVLTKDIESVSKHSSLLIKTLENKDFLIGDQTFKVKVYQMHLYTTLRLYLNVERKN
ncbi:sporulation membrane protein YtrI [Pseudalkalibacillus sp. SCS-8]|uniref:sporulation membrane protein YtrI n=1 Tax=Pseudalkalibacillus nanhaiensis TaxID=3115291 RepID=UPI0032DB27B7